MRKDIRGHLPFMQVIMKIDLTYITFAHVNVAYASVTHVKYTTMCFKITIFHMTKLVYPIALDLFVFSFFFFGFSFTSFSRSMESYHMKMNLLMCINNIKILNGSDHDFGDYRNLENYI